MNETASANRSTTYGLLPGSQGKAKKLADLAGKCAVNIHSTSMQRRISSSVIPEPKYYLAGQVQG